MRSRIGRDGAPKTGRAMRAALAKSGMIGPDRLKRHDAPNTQLALLSGYPGCVVDAMTPEQRSLVRQRYT